MSTAEVAAQVGVHRDTLLRWLRQGSVPEPQRDGRGWRVFSAADLPPIMAFARGGEALGNEAVTPHENAAVARLQAINWDFPDAKTGYLTHGLHPYPAKFIPQIPNALIQELSSVGDTIADIFCGSGTTLVEALQLKRHAIGIDANPLAALISQAKTTALDEANFAALSTHQDACQQLVQSIDPHIGDLFHGGRPFQSSAWRPAQQICEFWFEPHVVEELAELRQLTDAVPAEEARCLCQAALSAIIVAVSKQDSDTRYVRRDKAVAPGDTVRRYLSQLNAAAAAVRELTDLVEGRFSRQVFNLDILDAPDTEAFDLVVTSPPYPNAYSYHLYHRTRLAWLGHDPNQFKKVEIGSHRKYSAKGRNRATATTFQREFEQIFCWLRGRLRPRGHVCLVIGDSTLDGRRIDNASLVAAAAAGAGFRETARMERAIASTRKAFNPRIGKIKTEKLLILRKA